MKENVFSTRQTLNELQFIVKVRKSNKTKWIKQLNHKSNLNLHDGKTNTFKEFLSRQYLDVLIGKTRLRPQSICSTYSETNQNVSRTKSKKAFSKKTKLEGQVQFVDINGNRFKGTYQNGMRVQGRMIYNRAKCQYEGSFLGQKFHGHGKLTYFDGRTIEGQWEQHILIGNVIINYPNGDVYYGDVNKKLHRHGKGHLFLRDGDKYIGDFMNGSITGYGILYKNGHTVEGHWMQGQLIKQIRPDWQQDEQILQGLSIKRVQYLQSRGNVSNRDTKRVSQNKKVSQNIKSPVASHLRLNTQNSVKSREQMESSISTDQIINVVRRERNSQITNLN